MVCNLCGKKLDMWDVESGLSVRKEVGYGSMFDGCTVKIQLCCECTDELIAGCVESAIVKDVLPQ